MLATLNELPSVFQQEDNVDALITEYQNDLVLYIEQTNKDKNSDISSIKKKYYLNKLEEKWVRFLGFKKSDILGDIQELLTPKSNYKKSLSLKELLDSYNPGNSWIVPTLLRRTGLYILAAEPKVGKTILLNFLIYAFSVSNDFLGMPAKPARVLYIQLEESNDTMAERLLMTGFGNMLDEDATLAVNFADSVRIEREFDINTDLGWLIKKIEEYKADVVVIDSLRASQLTSTTDENTSQYGKAVYALQAVCNHADVCGIIIHHMNKLGSRNAEKTSLIDRLSGNTAISGGCDGLIGLSAEDTPEGRVLTMKTLPRQGIHLNIKYQLKTEDGLWKLHKLSEESAARSEYTSKILRFLALFTDKEFTAYEVANAVKCSFENPDFKESLLYLSTSQIITGRFKTKRFVYSLPHDSLWIVNPKKLKDTFAPSIIDANNLMRCLTKQDVRDLIKDWTKERQLDAKRLLLKQESEKLAKLVLSFEFAVGDIVLYQGDTYEVEKILSDSPSLNANEYKLKYLQEPINESCLSFKIVTVSTDNPVSTEIPPEIIEEVVF